MRVTVGCILTNNVSSGVKGYSEIELIEQILKMQVFTEN
jgi:hypothetical protein